MTQVFKNYPALSKQSRFFTDVEKDGVAASPTPFSDMLGFDLLSDRKPDIDLMTDDPTPFSTRFGWPVLSDRKPNVELMTDDPTPLSSRFGWNVLRG
ncbi:hypothetical protein C8N32_102208 [Rhodovulum imhoffii]|uniref:Uncharacterized protein n=1 Tax=Rhodovulum imhoffii TaxID=365340 RepID=A0A2T5BVT4_9RHOB|nr:hypothetical protein [Rhodovulum imhoffii]MBK5933218.1 hypothetical protein [Rhodovulum imhoffii]PTN03681.1 hypothetical protein C8N32_102208 [Rhodovulum imhoffii]